MTAATTITTSVGTIPVISPFPWEHLLHYLSRRLVPDVERVTADAYVRKVSGHEVTVKFDAEPGCLTISSNGPVDVGDTLRRIATLFAVTCDSQRMNAHLSQFETLRTRVARVPGMRPLAAWSPFELCVRTIVGQQVTVAAAGTLMQRLVTRCGEISAAGVLGARLEQLGMPGKRVESIRSLARAVADGSVSFEQEWTQVNAQLATLSGFGPWTRAYLAIRLGRDPDAFPQTDLGLIRAAGVDSPGALLQLAEGWRPWRGYAATYLWSVP